jgi:transcriptional regulator with PAS, ATPase and Fis domain
LLSSVTSGLAMMRDPAFARERFEEELRSIVNARSLSLCDDPLAPLPPNATCFDIPATTSSNRARLAAVFEPSRTLDGWTCQLLETATHIAALVLEVERGYLRGAGHRTRPDGAAPLIGSSRAIHAVRERIARVAATDFTVLIEGESGTGKELVARQIHDLSRRHKGPFVAVNCAAIVETLLEAELFGIEERTATGVKGRRGKFEHADGGTLFLDEVSDLSLTAQAKLLRAIQDLAVERVGGTGTQRVDIRIVAATNRSLAEMVERKLFRADLFYRLSGVDLRVPPLRERRDDVAELAAYFLERHRHVRTLRLSDAAREALQLYDWPGNVRELERMMERTVALAAGDVIELDDLPPAVRGDFAAVLTPALRRGDTMRAWGSRYARLVLDRCRGNKREASRVLGISYHTLNSYLRYPLSGPGVVDEEGEFESVDGIDEAVVAGG